MRYGKTDRFYLKRYVRGGDRLRVGDVVLVHPFVDGDGIIVSESLIAFEATIVHHEIKWNTGDALELCTHVEGGHSSVINEYLFSRLEKIGVKRKEGFIYRLFHRL